MSLHIHFFWTLKSIIVFVQVDIKYTKSPFIINIIIESFQDEFGG